MSRQQTDAPIDRVTVTYHVAFEPYQQRWRVEVTQLQFTTEGATVELGHLRREFGPFDNSQHVAQWLSQQVYSYTKTQATVDYTPPLPDPPQGRRLPDSE